MASPSELSLECKPQSYSMLLKSFGEQIDHCQTQKLEEFLSRLEEERLKIDAFKRELPLCMQLLTNAVDASRQQLQAYRSANQGPRPILEEFIPLKHPTTEDVKAASISDKANWMTSAQLWSQASDTNKQQTAMTPPPLKEPDIGFNVTSPKLGLDNKQRNGGAFLPFSKERNMSSPPTATCPSTGLRALPELALASNDRDMEDKKYCENENISNNNSNNNGVMTCNRRDNIKIGSNGGLLSEHAKMVVNTADQGQNASNNGASANGSNTAQTHRKARRCWSPDLHRRFVNALQMLGGSQVATPKQIRELMKVDGLTNDEVKSHLQKYRLHTRRPSPSPQAPGAPTPQLVVLGGIWVPPDYATAAAAAAAHGGPPALYGPHPTAHQPPHYCATPAVPPEYYAAAAPSPSPTAQQHEIHHSFHHQLHVYKAAGASQAQSSPESGLRGAGDRSESIEDGKSESNSWNKGDSSENNGGERRGLAAMREDNEESNGSEITLKF